MGKQPIILTTKVDSDLRTEKYFNQNEMNVNQITDYPATRRFNII